MKVSELRSLFPELSVKVYGKELCYLDSAATSLRPYAVLEKWSELASERTANIHRSVHYLSNVATAEFENARDCVKSYLGASDRNEIIFTSGTTAAINLVASSFGDAFVREGDEILVSESSHHSDIVPWQFVCSRKNAKLKAIPLSDNGMIDLESLRELINERTRIVAVDHISNVLGVVNPIEEIVRMAHSKGVPVLVDGAQGIVHCRPDVQETGCDFYVFSGHKIFAATGVGVLYGRKELLEKMPPYMGGGEMIDTVTFEKTTYAALPFKFEAGTPDFTSVPTLVPALKLLDNILNDNEIAAEQKKILAYVPTALSEIPGLHLYGSASERIPTFSFSVDGVHHEDLALVLDKMGISVRSGHMCAEPLMRRFGVEGMVRASFGFYNTCAEAERFVECLKKAVDMLR